MKDSFKKSDKIEILRELRCSPCKGGHENAFIMISQHKTCFQLFFPFFFPIFDSLPKAEESMQSRWRVCVCVCVCVCACVRDALVNTITAERKC